MDIEIKGGLSMNHDTTQSDWRTVTNCLASHDYVSIVKGLVHHFAAIEDEEILDNIYDDFMNDDLNQLVQRYIDKMS